MKRVFLSIIAVLLLLPVSVSFGAAFSANEQVTSTKLNTLNNANVDSSAAIDPEKIDDHSATAAEQDTTSDPYAGDAQTLATDLSIELRQLRYTTEEIKQAFPAATLAEKWYQSIALGAQGEIPYWNATRFTKLGVGTSGQFLQTKGASANPVWATSMVYGDTRVKTVTSSRTAASGTGTQSITGAGFTPTSAEFVAHKDASAMASWSTKDSAISSTTCMYKHNNGNFARRDDEVIYITDGTDVMGAVLTSYDSDGITLTWTKTGNGHDIQFFVVLRR